MLDACDKEQPGPEPSTSTSDDLQSRGSIQYTTRVKPDAENKQFYTGDSGPIRNAINTHEYAKVQYDYNMPPVPVELEENLRKDFYKPRPAESEQLARDNNDRLSASATSRQNVTLYTYPSSNYTYGNVPFYMPKVHYGSAQPVKSPVYNYVLPSHSVNSNNNYRPTRQPAIGHFYAQPNTLHDHRPVPMGFYAPKPHVAVKHGYRVSGKRLPSNGPPANGAHRSVVYKKPVYKFNVRPAPPTHYDDPAPASPVHQPVRGASGGHFQHAHQQQQSQQPAPVHQQPSTSMSQSVSVTYSSSKHQQPQRPTDGHTPIQNRQETNVVGPYHKSQGGFNPDTVVVEGGFVPIIPGGGVPQDRSDGGGAGADGFDDTVRHREKKTSKKLISRKPAARRRADDTTENAEERLQETTIAVDDANPAITASTAESKQTADVVV